MNPTRTDDSTSRSLCIVIHDVAPQTEARCRELRARLAEIGDFPVTLLAVPRHHGIARNAAFEHWLVERADRGDEVALHGYRHLDDGTPHGWVDRLRRQVYTRGEGEFWDLPLDEAERRIDAGLAWLNELDIAPAGFVAPAWLMGPSAWQAVRARGFEYTCTLKQIVSLAHAGACATRIDGDAASAVGHVVLDCQAQVYSSSTAWRRWMSVAWNESLARLQREQAVVRLELHPVDLQAPVQASWWKLARAQARTRRVETMQAIAARVEAARLQ